jgi:putative transposase
MDTVWNVMSDYLYLLHHGFGTQIHAFVLITSPAGNMSQALLYFMRETSKEISRLSGRINQTYGNRNHSTLLSDPMYFINSYKYIYQNPIRAGICERVEEYPYSTLPGLLGLRPLAIPVAYDTLLFEPADLEESLLWLNRKPKDEHIDEIRRALRKPEFELRSKDRKESRLKCTKL